MSKGSRRRPCDERKVSDNWDQIKWGSKGKGKNVDKKGQPNDRPS